MHSNDVIFLIVNLELMIDNGRGDLAPTLDLLRKFKMSHQLFTLL